MGVDAFELLVDAKVALHGKQRVAAQASQVRVALSSAGNLVSGPAVLGPLGDSADLGLAEVVARGVLAEVDLDAAMLGRYAGGCSLLLVVLKTLDGLIEGIGGGQRPPPRLGKISWSRIRLYKKEIHEVILPRGP